MVASSRFEPRDTGVRQIRDMLSLWLLDADADAAEEAAPSTPRRIPSETELMQIFGANRAVVRRALGLLAQTGAIERRRGIGSAWFGSAPVVELDSLQGGYTNHPREGALTTQHVVLDWTVMDAPPPLSRRLTPSGEAGCLRAELLVHAGGRPIAVGSHYLRAPEHLRLDRRRAHADWYSYLIESGIGVGHADVVLRPAVADEADAHLLEIEPGTPIMVSDGTVQNPQGEAIGFFHSRGPVAYRLR